MDNSYFLVINLGLLVLLPRTVDCLFPALCAGNATKTRAVCCPVPPGFDQPCGGPGRGLCQEILEADEQFDPFPEHTKHDDRIDWPRKFFQHACFCEGNYMGYMCSECTFGYTGNTCDVKYTLVRKDARTLTAGEKEQFRRVVNKAKTTRSEYVVLSNVYDIDPVYIPQFQEVSVYDHIVYIHHYAARFTASDGDQTKCRSNTSGLVVTLDGAHKGSAFPTWHRLFLLFWEREIQKASGEYDFSFPYWNWTAGEDSYKDVCTNDLVGAMNLSDPEGRLDRNSDFYHWIAICQDVPDENGCLFCNPREPGKPLRRLPHSGHALLPDHKEEVFTLSRVLYDTEPYSKLAGLESFRNAMEGFTSPQGVYASTQKLTMHNSAHAFFTGTIGPLQTSPNDPIFILIHSYVDKLFEIWLRRHGDDTSQLAETGAPFGHNRNSPLVGFFPRYLNSWYFAESSKFGFDYDDMQAHNEAQSQESPVNKHNAPISQKREKQQHKAWPTSTAVVLGILSGISIAIVLAIFLRGRIHRMRHGRLQITETIGQKDLLSNEGMPLLGNNSEE